MEIVKITETKFVRKIKSLPISTQKILGLIVLITLLIALPLFIWALITQRVFFKQKAASGEMSGEPGVCIAYNNFVDVTPVTDVSAPCHNIQSAINAVANNGTVMIEPGIYNINSTINVNGKTNITITGNTYYSNDAAVLNFIPNGWGFLVQNSSGSIQKLKIQGGSSNGMISILNSSDFQLSYLKVSSNTSHTIDVQRSTNININNSEISSSAGAVEIDQSHNINILNNRIHDSATAIRANNSTYVTIIDNIITANTGGAINIWNIANTGIHHNTIINNMGSVPTVGISGLNTSPNVFSQNIVAFNTGQGIYKDANANNFSTISFNDVFNNYNGSDYVGMTNPTGTNGNISADPKLDIASGYYCLLSGSPALYGVINNREYMGKNGPCVTSTPIPSSGPVSTLPPHPSPTGLLTPLTTNGRPWQGTENAPITIFEFIDFECPFCKMFFDQTYADLMNAYPGKIRFIFKEFPLTQIHPNAQAAAEAAECAHLQNKFWEMTGVLYQHQSELGTVPMSTLAQSIGGLNVAQFNSCITNHQTAQTITNDINEGASIGINGTPTFFINGQLVTGAYPLNYFKQIIDQILSSSTPTPSPSPSPNPGDVNRDGRVNIVDIGIIIDNYRRSPITDPRADINKDGVVNIVDIGIIIDNYEF